MIPLWRWESREWSHVTAPQSRWRLGASLGWRSSPHDVSRVSVQSAQSSPQNARSAVTALRLSVFIPHERLLELTLERGVITEARLERLTRAFTIAARLTYASAIRISTSAQAWGDHQLGVARQLDRVTLDVPSRSALWGELSAHLRVMSAPRYETWVYMGGRFRHTTEDDLPALTTAALAESRLTGDGLSGWGGVYLKRMSAPELKSWLPHRLGLTYAYVDPHLRFGYDTRPRLRADLTYEASILGVTLGATLWYTHLWSAPENRWEVASDMLGLTLGARL